VALNCSPCCTVCRKVQSKASSLSLGAEFLVERRQRESSPLGTILNYFIMCCAPLINPRSSKRLKMHFRNRQIERKKMIYRLLFWSVWCFMPVNMWLPWGLGIGIGIPGRACKNKRTYNPPPTTRRNIVSSLFGSMDVKLIYRPTALSSRFVVSPLICSRIQYGLLGISTSLRFNAEESGFNSWYG